MKKYNGFTLNEMVVVLGIFSLITAFSLPLYQKLRHFTFLEPEKEQLIQNLRLQKLRSEEMLRGHSFGIYFQQSQYTLYEGDSYVERISANDEIISLNYGVIFIFSQFILDADNGVDVHFSQKLGTPNNIGTIRIFHADSGGSRFISINMLGFIQEARDGKITLYPARDSYIYQYSPTTNYGTGNQLMVYPWPNTYNRRSIIQFDLSSIPFGAMIQSAKFYLHESDTQGITRNINLYRVTQDWTEAGVSWSKRDGNNSWQTSGGTFVSEPSSVNVLSWTGTLKWDNWNVKNDIQLFLNGVYTNYGWIIKDSVENTQTYWFFSSKEGSYSPYLEIEYTL